MTVKWCLSQGFCNPAAKRLSLHCRWIDQIWPAGANLLMLASVYERTSNVVFRNKQKIRLGNCHCWSGITWPDEHRFFRRFAFSEACRLVPRSFWTAGLVVLCWTQAAEQCCGICSCGTLLVNLVVQLRVLNVGRSHFECNVKLITWTKNKFQQNLPYIELMNYLRVYVSCTGFCFVLFFPL